MKIIHLLRLAFFGLFFLTSCANNNFAPPSQVNRNLTREGWMQQVNTNPNLWTQHADAWYFTGEPNQTERSANYAGYSNSMTVAAVKVPQFTNVNVVGGFQVQLVGMQDQNSVYVLGTNAAVRQVSIKVRGDTLYVCQVKNGEAAPVDLRRTIIRIGVHNLRGLTVTGGTTVEGRNLMSDGLNIVSYTNCMVLLNGNLNVTKISQMGSGTVSVLGAYSPSLVLYACGNGTINVSGRVAVRKITNTDRGSINVIGLNSPCLDIHASGNSFTGLAGYANLRRLTAEDCSRVYLYWVNAKGTYVTVQDQAIVGLAGCVTNLNADLSGSARLQGRYLHGTNVYVRTRNTSHVNIAADQRIFAAAGDSSSVYFFGSPPNVSRFMTQNGTVLPVWTDEPANTTPAGVWTRPAGKQATYK